VIEAGATSVRGAASAALVVGLAASALAQVDFTSAPAPAALVTNYRAIEAREEAIVYAHQTLYCIDHDCEFESGFSDGRWYASQAPATPIGVHVGMPVVVGAMERSILKRYVRRRTDKLKVCFQGRELAPVDPILEVIVELTIDPTGHVMWARSSGEMAGCIERVMRTLELPAPEDGGIVQAIIPISFAPPARLARYEHRPCASERREQVPLECEVLPRSMLLDWDPTLAMCYAERSASW
jgi:hypothetical protein